MKPVYQSVISKETGDCFSACIASILEIELTDVPNFQLGGLDFWRNAADWFRSKGYGFAEISADRFLDDPVYLFYTLAGAHVIICVPSQKFENTLHSVVGKFNGIGKLSIVHDPNPNNVPYHQDNILRIGFIFKR